MSGADVPRRGPRPRGPDRRLAGDAAGRSGDARRIAGRRPACAATRIADCRKPAPTRGALLDEAAELLFRHSLFNGHPRFFGYITSSPAPIGALGDLLASAVNQNVGAWRLSPMATEIEAQTVRWIAELIGFPTDAGGLLVSGGNMANFVCFLAARTAKATRTCGRAACDRSTAPLRVYASTETHTWIQKAADLFGLGTDAIRWIPADEQQRMDVAALERSDRRRPQRTESCRSWWSAPPDRSAPARSIRCADIAGVCRRHDVWFHVDGAYGALAARVPGAPESLLGAQRSRFGGRRSAQVAVRAARSRLRAGAAPRRSAARVLLPSELLPLRPRGDELLRLRPAELARLPGAEGVAGAAPGRAVGLSADDRRRHAPRAASARARAAASGVRGDDAASEHHDVPLRPARPSVSAARRRRPRRTCSG